MREPVITKAMIISWGGPGVYQQAEKVCKRGAVLRAELHGNVLEGDILQESGSLHTGMKILDDGTVESFCPCYHNQQYGTICVHVIAIAITLLRRMTDPARERRYQEEKRRAEHLATIPKGSFIQRDRHGILMQIQITLLKDWIQEFYDSKITVKVSFLTPNQKITPEQILQMHAPLALSAKDDDLLFLVEDICLSTPPSQFTVSPTDFLQIVNLTRHRPIQIEDGTPLQVSHETMEGFVQTKTDPETGEIRIAAMARRETGEVLTGEHFFVAGQLGYLLRRNFLYPFKNLLPAPCHDIYQGKIKIARKDVICFLRESLPVIKKWVPVEMDVTPDMFEQVPGKPIMHLELRGSLASLRATVKAAYGPYLLSAGHPDAQSSFSLPDPEDILRYIVRDIWAEKKEVALMSQFGFKENGRDFILADARKVLNFLGGGYQALGRRGWRIYFSGKLESLIEKIPAITPVVKIDRPNSSEFEVGYVFEAPNHESVPQPEIQRALNRGDSYLEHGDKLFFIDKTVVESMRSVFSDCEFRTSRHSGNFLLPNVYAPFVQASLNHLEGIDIEAPDDWQTRAAIQNRKGNTHFQKVDLGVLEGTLRPYQKEGVYWLRFLEESGLCGLLADEMGLGKTLQTLCWLNLPRSREGSRNKPSLVICPTSLAGNWAHEAQKFLPDLKVLVISGPDRNTLFKKIPDQNLVITSYALIRRDLKEYNSYTFGAVVLDEAQHIKNRSTQNAIAVKAIRSDNKLVLTGTPIENSVADIWSIMDFLMPGYLGVYDHFKVDYEVPISVAGQEGEEAQQKLNRKLHPFILRRIKKDVAKDLPDKIVKVSYCTLTDEQQKVYNELLTDSRDIVGDMVKARGFEKSKFEILAILMRLRQACCHLGLLTNRPKGETYKEPSAKLDAFLEILDEAMRGGHRILVFSQFVKMLTLIRKALEERNIPYCYLDGSTKDRIEQCQKFNQTPTIPVFLISLKAGGTGLNLTGADMVVHFDPWWNPAVEDQATDRAHRIGQKRTVYSIKLIAEDTIEERVLAMQRRKQAVIQATIGTTDSSVMQKLSFEDIKDLIGL